MAKTTRWQKIFLIFFGVILFIILLELGLRLGGFFLSSLQEYRNMQSIKQKGAYRIMCLGESTTVGQYPSYLEEVLNQRNIGIRFSVIDKGIDGARTGFLVSQLKSNLNKYKSDLVVTMMGINDTGPHMFYEEIPDSKIALIFKPLRVYKLARLIWLHIKTRVKELGFKAAYAGEDKLTQQEDNLKKAVELNPDNTQAYVNLGRLYSEQKRFPEAEQALKKALELNPKNDQAYTNLGRLYREQKRLPEAEQALEKALKLNPNNDQAYSELGEFYKDQKRFPESEQVLKKAPKPNSSTYRAYLTLGWLYMEQGKFPEAELIFKKAIELDPDNNKLYRWLAILYKETGNQALYAEYSKKASQRELYGPITTDNYRKLKQILDENKVRLACVQYPMRSIKPLKKMLEGLDGVIFVDNEEIFKSAITRESYKEYFRDIFGGDFGHCTEKGNRLLAGNIANAILKEVFGR